MASPRPATGSFYDFTVKDIKGNDVDLSIYKGKVLLVINVASKCGLTNSNYDELNQLYQNYKDQDGNGFKTSTMRLGADVIVFSRAIRAGKATQKWTDFFLDLGSISKERANIG